MARELVALLHRREAICTFKQIEKRVSKGDT